MPAANRDKADLRTGSGTTLPSKWAPSPGILALLAMDIVGWRLCRISSSLNGDNDVLPFDGGAGECWIVVRTGGRRFAHQIDRLGQRQLQRTGLLTGCAQLSSMLNSTITEDIELCVSWQHGAALVPTVVTRRALPPLTALQQVVPSG
jgi:hypothetical protein